MSLRACRSSVLFLSAMSFLPPAPAAGQASRPAHACTDPRIDNFRHPPGTKTAAKPGLGHVEKSGRGPVPMILIPGAAFDWIIWKGFMRRNADRYTMYAITPAGYGDTPPPPMPPGDDPSKRNWSDAVLRGLVELIDKERLDRPIVVGHHMLGDYYAIRLAVEHADRVRGLVVVAGTPGFAMPAYGANQPGSSVKLADAKQRIASVQQFWKPFYRQVTPEMWRAGSFQARRFCRNKARAAELFDQQIAVPIPTQIRYFMEYLADDPTAELATCPVPVLAVLPRQRWNLDAALEAYRESNELMYGGDIKQARAGWTRNMETAWGSVEQGIKWSYDMGFQWEQLRRSVPRLSVKLVANSGIFIMEDQPGVLDDVLAGFVAGLRRASPHPAGGLGNSRRR